MSGIDGHAWFSARYDCVMCRRNRRTFEFVSDECESPSGHVAGCLARFYSEYEPAIKAKCIEVPCDGCGTPGAYRSQVWVDPKVAKESTAWPLPEPQP